MGSVRGIVYISDRYRRIIGRSRLNGVTPPVTLASTFVNAVPVDLIPGHVIESRILTVKRVSYKSHLVCGFQQQRMLGVHGPECNPGRAVKDIPSAQLPHPWMGSRLPLYPGALRH